MGAAGHARYSLLTTRYWLRSFDHHGHDDHVVALGRGVAKGGLDGQARLRRGVGGRLDPGDVDLAELLDVAEHVAELARKDLLLLWGQREPREVRDVVDVDVGRGSHGLRSIRKPGSQENAVSDRDLLNSSSPAPEGNRQKS